MKTNTQEQPIDSTDSNTVFNAPIAGCVWFHRLIGFTFQNVPNLCIMPNFSCIMACDWLYAKKPTNANKL